MWLACAMFKVKVLQNCLLFLPQADLVTLSFLSSWLTVVGRDQEWAASPLHLRKRVWPACMTCWVPFKLSSGPLNFDPEQYPVRSRHPSSAQGRTAVSQQLTMVSATRPAGPVPALSEADGAAARAGPLLLLMASRELFSRLQPRWCGGRRGSSQSRVR